MDVKRFFMAVLGALLLIAPGLASAESVVAEGYGLGRESAMREAMRAAIEEAAGVFVDSRTVVSAGRLALDDIYAESEAFVTDATVLEEEAGPPYHVRLQAEVDTSPDAALADRLKTVMLLNDPRIAVVVHHDGVRAYAAEEAMDARLLELGFSHVTDLTDAELEAGLASLKVRGSAGGRADFLVLGEARMNAVPVNVPEGADYVETGLFSGRTLLSVSIVRFDTGEAVESFTVSGLGAEVSSDRAEGRSLVMAAGRAADSLEQSLRRVAASPRRHLVVTLYASPAAAEMLADEIESLPLVKNVYLRASEAGRATISVEGSLSAGELWQMLRERTTLPLTPRALTSSTLVIGVK